MEIPMMIRKGVLNPLVPVLVHTHMFA